MEKLHGFYCFFQITFFFWDAFFSMIMKNVLTIAGSDSGGGAGIQADLKTFSAHRTFGMSVITAITAQNTQGVFAIQDIALDVIEKQIDAIFSDFEVDAVRRKMTPGHLNSLTISLF